MAALRLVARNCHIARGAVVAVLALSARAAAQTHYHNSESGRPTRVEDALPIGRYALGITFVPLQFESFIGGTKRYRAEPKLGYGILPLTEVEVGFPLVQLNPPALSGAKPVAGLAGLSIGVMHAFNIETARMPSLAIAGDVSVPLGNLAPTQSTYLVKGLLTRTMRVGRVHVNAGGGTYSLRPTVLYGTGCATPGNADCPSGVPIILDVPCNVVPRVAGRYAALRVQRCMPTQPESLATAPRLDGARWFAGLGADHAFALRSTLIVADVFAEQFVGLYPTINWTAEAGFRRQFTTMMVIDGGVGWRFAGAVRSVSLVLGISYELATPPLIGR